MRNILAIVFLIFVSVWDADAQQMQSGRVVRASDGVPARGRTPEAVDPTENVKELVSLSIKRLDDLRIAESRRLEDLQAANDRRLTELANIREAFQQKLVEAEAKRIDAIRAVDVNAVSIATERATQQANVLAAQVTNQATVLAAQVTQSAETLRNLVASSAATLAAQQDQVSKQFEARLAQLEKSQYTNQGQNVSGVAALMAERLSLLEKSQNESSGKGAGAASVVGYILGGIGVLVGLGGLLMSRRQQATYTAPANVTAPVSSSAN